MSDHEVSLAQYSRALDEIYALRSGMAYEAAVIEQVLGQATLPAGARQSLTHTLNRLWEGARGEWEDAWHRFSPSERQDALRTAGARPTLTRAAWEAERTR